MLVEDPREATDTEQITINITPTGAENQSPTAEIQQPSNEQVINQGDLVILQGSGTDPEDVTIQGFRLSWSSDLNGVLGTGQSLFIDTLQPSKHTITLTARDSGGKEHSTSITLSISPPVAQFGMVQTLPPPVPNIVKLNLGAVGIHNTHDAPSIMEVKWDFD